MLPATLFPIILTLVSYHRPIALLPFSREPSLKIYFKISRLVKKKFINVVPYDFYAEKAAKIPASLSVPLYRFWDLMSTHQATQECSKDVSFLNEQVRENEQACGLVISLVSAPQNLHSLTSRRVRIVHSSLTYLAQQCVYPRGHRSHGCAWFTSSQLINTSFTVQIPVSFNS
jgi:hypothetical protein